MYYIENQYVSFLIVTSDQTRKTFKRILIAVIILFPVLRSYFPELESPLGFVAWMSAFVLAILFCIVQIRIRQPYQELGMIILYFNRFVIQDGHATREIPLEHIDSITFLTTGFKGQPYFLLLNLYSRSGLGNKLTFTTRDGIYQYEVFVTNKLKANILDRLLDHYKKTGVKVRRQSSFI